MSVVGADQLRMRPHGSKNGKGGFLTDAYIKTSNEVTAAVALLLVAIILVRMLASPQARGLPGFLRKPAVMIKNGVAVALVAVSLLGQCAVVNVFQILFSPLYYISPPIWYFFGNAIWMPMWAICIVGTEVFGNMKIEWQGEMPLPGEKVIILSNHLSVLDWVIHLSLAARCDALPGIRFIAKSPIKKIPLIGFGMYMTHCVFVNSRPEGRADGTTAEQRAATVADDMKKCVLIFL